MLKRIFPMNLTLYTPEGYLITHTMMLSSTLLATGSAVVRRRLRGDIPVTHDIAILAFQHPPSKDSSYFATPDNVSPTSNE
jgi:hypothetical protein